MEPVVPVVALAIVLFYLQCDSEGIEVAVRRTGQCCVPDVCRPRRTPKGCGKTVQDTTDLDGKGKKIEALQTEQEGSRKDMVG